MAHLDVPLLPEINHQEDQQILLVDKLYSKAYEHFEICVIINMIYSALKAIAAPFFILLSDPRKTTEEIWLIIIIPISILQFVYNWQVKKFSKKKQVYLIVANQVRHAQFFIMSQVSMTARHTNIHDNIVNFRNLAATEVVQKQMKILSLEIKYDVLKQDWKIMVAGRVLFVMYTALHIWGYIIFATSGSTNLADYYIIVVFFIGTYQYLEIYIGLIGLIIISPFLLVYLAVREIKKRRRASKVTRRLKGKKYSPQSHKGQILCHICMCQYKQQDMITTLQCNQMHHFHQACLAEWVKISSTCPLCRLQVQTS